MDWKPTYDKEDLEVSPLIKSTIILFAVIGVALVIVWVQIAGFRRIGNRMEPAPSIFAQQNRKRLPPEPRLQTSPPADLAAMRAQEDEILTHYAWIDRDAGVVRLPIRRAMELVASEGLPARPAQNEAGRR
jgi:hypothetical protein